MMDVTRVLRKEPSLFGLLHVLTAAHMEDGQKIPTQSICRGPLQSMCSVACCRGFKNY